MKKHLSLSFGSSLFAIVCYLACTLLAFTHYPLPYSPLNNWLSDLGNPDLLLSRFERLSEVERSTVR